MGNSVSTLENKISENISFKSFQAERRVADILSRSKWESTHGLFYVDLQTNKHRELDVVAHQVWNRTHRDVEQRCRITLLIEVKSMSGFHLLLSEHPATSQDFYQHIHWFGDPSGKYAELSQQLNEIGVDPKKILALTEKLHGYAYPRQHARMWSMMVRPQPVAAFTSFRETNLGGEKDLDNSVFWRASQNLRSAHMSIAKEIRCGHLETLIGAAEYEARSKNWLDSMLWWASQQVCIVDIIHPIVVTDAMIWATTPEGVKKRDYARFGTHTYTGLMDWWCDLVNSDHIEEYVNKLTSYYRKRLRSARAKMGA